MTLDFSNLRLIFRRGGATSEPVAPAEDEVVIGYTENKRPVTLGKPSQDRGHHHLVVGATGCHKTVLLSAALATEVARTPREELGLVLVDPKGDLLTFLHALAACAPDRLADCVVIDPFAVSPFPFNLTRLDRTGVPLELRALELALLCASLSTEQGSQKSLGAGSRQIDVTQNVLAAVLAADHAKANPTWAVDALVAPRGKGLKQLAEFAAGAGRAKQFLETAFLSDELAASCAARLRLAFTASTAIERMMAADTSVQFADLTAPGRIVLIDCSRPTAGLSALQIYWASLLTRLLLSHLIQARPCPSRGHHHLRIVVDEAPMVLNSTIVAEAVNTLVTTGRSRNLSIVLICQGTSQIQDPALLSILVGNTTRIVGRCCAKDADLLARDVAPGAGVDESASSVRARVSSSISNLADGEFYRFGPGRRERFTNIQVDMNAWKTAAQRHAAAIGAARNRLAMPPDFSPRVSLADALAERRAQQKRQDKSSPSKSRPRSGSAATSDESTGPKPKPRSRWG
ncbi:MAG: hypothetical protein WC526_00830 [Patescibacteria group bacterium]